MKRQHNLCYYVAQLLTEKVALEQVAHSHTRETIQNTVSVRLGWVSGMKMGNKLVMGHCLSWNVPTGYCAWILGLQLGGAVLGGCGHFGTLELTERCRTRGEEPGCYRQVYFWPEHSTFQFTEKWASSRMLHLSWMDEPSTPTPSHHHGPNPLNHEPELALPSLSCFCQVFVKVMRRIAVTVILILRLFCSKLLTFSFI